MICLEINIGTTDAYSLPTGRLIGLRIKPDVMEDRAAIAW